MLSSSPLLSPVPVIANTNSRPTETAASAGTTAAPNVSAMPLPTPASRPNVPEYKKYEKEKETEGFTLEQRLAGKASSATVWFKIIFFLMANVLTNSFSLGGLLGSYLAMPWIITISVAAALATVYANFISKTVTACNPVDPLKPNTELKRFYERLDARIKANKEVYGTKDTVLVIDEEEIKKLQSEEIDLPAIGGRQKKFDVVMQLLANRHGDIKVISPAEAKAKYPDQKPQPNLILAVTANSSDQMLNLAGALPPGAHIFNYDSFWEGANEAEKSSDKRWSWLRWLVIKGFPSLVLFNQGLTTTDAALTFLGGKNLPGGAQLGTLLVFASLINWARIVVNNVLKGDRAIAESRILAEKILTLFSPNDPALAKKNADDVKAKTDGSKKSDLHTPLIPPVSDTPAPAPAQTTPAGDIDHHTINIMSAAAAAPAAATPSNTPQIFAAEGTSTASAEVKQNNVKTEAKLQVEAPKAIGIVLVALASVGFTVYYNYTTAKFYSPEPAINTILQKLPVQIDMENAPAMLVSILNGLKDFLTYGQIVSALVLSFMTSCKSTLDRTNAWLYKPAKESKSFSELSGPAKAFRVANGGDSLTFAVNAIFNALQTGADKGIAFATGLAILVTNMIWGLDTQNMKIANAIIRAGSMGNLNQATQYAPLSDEPHNSEPDIEKGQGSTPPRDERIAVNPPKSSRCCALFWNKKHARQSASVVDAIAPEKKASARL